MYLPNNKKPLETVASYFIDNRILTAEISAVFFCKIDFYKKN